MITEQNWEVIRNGVLRGDFAMVRHLVEQALKPDMFWNKEDAEDNHSSVHDVISEAWLDGTIEDGAEITILQAMRLPETTYKVTALPGDDDGFNYEEIKP